MTQRVKRETIHQIKPSYPKASRKLGHLEETLKPAEPPSLGRPQERLRWHPTS